MIYTGTAAELAELTRKWWAAEWWPKRMEWLDLSSVWTNGWLGYDVDVAASIIFAAAWVAKCEGFELYKPRFHWKGWTVVETRDEDPMVAGEGPSPLHAVLAALEVVG